MEDRKTIDFGKGMLDPTKDIDEKRIHDIVQEINKETTEAGLPWWAGMFNPKIVEASKLKTRECTCNAQKDSGHRSEESMGSIGVEKEFKEYCNKCTEIEPELKYDQLWANGEVCMTQIVVKCKHAKKCEAIHRHMKGA